MKTILGGSLLGAALLLGTSGTSQAQMMGGWGMLDGCRAGYTYDLSKDACVKPKKAKKAARKKSKKKG